MQVHDLPYTRALEDFLPDLSFSGVMSDPRPSSSSGNSQSNSSQDKESPARIDANHVEDNDKNGNFGSKSDPVSEDGDKKIVRRERPSRACTQRAAARMQAAAVAEAAVAAAEKKKHRKKGALRKERLTSRLLKEEVEEEEEEVEEDMGEEGEEEGSPSGGLRNQHCSRIVTPLVAEPEPSQLPRWKLLGMSELASVLDFLNVFRPLLNVKVEFSVEELETALITPNKTLAEIHMPLLKIRDQFFEQVWKDKIGGDEWSIPPTSRVALGHSTWITVLCRKLRNWWHAVAEGEIPIVASQGAEIEAYNALDPAVRVLILKALCEIRVGLDDIRNHIDHSIKQGVHLSSFRKERIGGDSHGISYWYEDDPVIGHRLYREIRQVEVKKGKGKSVPPIPNLSYQWTTIATNLDEFQDVSEKLFASKNKTEVAVGKKLKNDMLPEIEKVHKRKEKLLKKQHRQALMLDNMMNVDGLLKGRSLRDRKQVTYTFDDYDKSINEAIKITKKKHPSPEPTGRRDPSARRERDNRVQLATNGRWDGPSHSVDGLSPKSSDLDGFYDENGEESLDRSNRRRQRPQRYAAGDFVEGVSDFEANMDSDDDIEGEAIYDEEYLRRKKRSRHSSSSEGSEEYRWDGDELPEEEEDEDEDDDFSNPSEDSDQPRKFRKLPGRTRRQTKLRSARAPQSGLRRSERATRNRIDYKQYEFSDSDTELPKPRKFSTPDEHSNASENEDVSMDSEETEEEADNEDMKVDQSVEEEEEGQHVDPPVEEEEEQHETEEKEVTNPPEKSSSPHEDEGEAGGKMRFLDLNELAPGSGLDDGPTEDDDTDDL